MIVSPGFDSFAGHIRTANPVLKAIVHQLNGGKIILKDERMCGILYRTCVIIVRLKTRDGSFIIPIIQNNNGEKEPGANYF